MAVSRCFIFMYFLLPVSYTHLDVYKRQSLYTALGIFLPLITTNCAVLGVVLLNVQNNYNFICLLYTSI